MNTPSAAGGRPATFVMTLKLDDSSFSHLQALRTRHFPPERNFIPAHLTLLHTVSVDQVARLRTSWCELDCLAPVRLQFTAPRWLGNGVAIDVDSVELQSRRARLLELMSGTFTRQDEQPFRAHVTVQNKVPAEEAKALYRSLCATFEPWTGEGSAVLIWHYLGGPWSLESQLAFSG
jgi:2'-5' RNA ligase